MLRETFLLKEKNVWISRKVNLVDGGNKYI